VDAVALHLIPKPGASRAAHSVALTIFATHVLITARIFNGYSAVLRMPEFNLQALINHPV